nr:zinc finger protein 271-like isoform X2 [Leptinotarsa decemlineata]
MATSDCGYGRPIKEEGEDETLQVNLSKNEFGPEKIKDEDEMSIVQHDLKSEQCAEDVKEGFYCEGCGGDLLSLENFFNPDSVKSCCNCQYQNDANHGEDCGIFSSKPPEETIVIKKEVTSENTSSTSCEKAFAVEIFSSGYYSNSFGESRIHEKNEVFSKNSNERIDEECVENKTTEEYPVHHKVCTKLFIGSSDLNNHIDSKPFQSRICTDSFNLLDCGIFSSKPPEETIVIKKEVTSENMSSTSCEKEFDVEIFNSGYYSNSFGERKIHEENEVFSKNLNERTDGKCVENKTTEKSPVHHEVCTKSFIGRSDLKVHENICTGKKRFQCKFCLKSFNHCTDFKNHERIHTGEKPYQCKFCSKSFSQCSSLKNHERIHTGEKPFQCKFCSKSFNQISHLKIHETFHTGEKPFQCKICSKSFNQCSTLKKHEKIHTGEKPFQCKICSKLFNQSSSVRMHEKIHTGVKPFQCKTCSKSFIQKIHLRNHEKTHAGEKPFQCENCLKSFSQVRYLKKHEKIHTGNEPFQ